MGQWLSGCCGWTRQQLTACLGGCVDCVALRGGQCLSGCVDCATFFHDKYTNWRWDDGDFTDLDGSVATLNKRHAFVTRSRTIHSAIIDKNVNEIRRILAEDEDARQDINGSFETGLHLACKLGYQQVIDVLLDNGCLPVVCTELGTPMHSLLQAVKSGYMTPNDAVTFIYILAHRGCDIEARDRAGKTALFVATEQGNISCLEALLHLGAQLNCQESNLFTPLYMSAIRGDLECVRILLHLAPRVDVDARDMAGRTPLFAALITIMNNLRYERLPNDIYHVNDRGEGGIEITRQNRSAIVEALLQAGADPNAMDMHGRTPMTVAFIIVELDNIRGSVFQHPACSVQVWACHTAPSIEDLMYYKPAESNYAILIRLLLLFGAIVPDGWHRDVSKAPDWLQALYQMCKDASSGRIKYFVQRPAHLQHLVRMNIRAHLANIHQLHNALRLPLPPALCDYIAIKYI